MDYDLKRILEINDRIIKIVALGQIADNQHVRHFFRVSYLSHMEMFHLKLITEPDFNFFQHALHMIAAYIASLAFLASTNIYETA